MVKHCERFGETLFVRKESLIRESLLSCTRDRCKWGNDSLFQIPNCQNLTSRLVYNLELYRTSLHITPHVPIREIRDTETASALKQ